SAQFEWGKTTAYGQFTPAQSVGAGSTALAVSAGLVGLTPNATYHYRLVATNSAGTTHGSDRMFRALGPPIVVTGAASSITKTAAHTNGTVNPRGAATTAHFQWGTTTAYGKSTATQSLAAGALPVAVAAAL